MAKQSLSSPMLRMALLGTSLALVGCTAPSVEAGGDTAATRQAPYPKLIPLDRSLWSQADASDPGAEVTAQAARLRARAAALQAADL